MFTADIIDNEPGAAIKEDVGTVLNAGYLAAGESNRRDAMEQWITNNLLEVVTLYGKEGRVLLQGCQRSWLDMWESTDGKRAVTFEDYLSQRIRGYGTSYVHTFQFLLFL